jgi:hypothetical protein
MSRPRFTQSEIDRLSKAAAKTGVPIVAEFVAPDGSKIIITAGKGGVSGGAERRCYSPTATACYGLRGACYGLHGGTLRDTADIRSRAEGI